MYGYGGHQWKKLNHWWNHSSVLVKRIMPNKLKSICQTWSCGQHACVHGNRAGEIDWSTCGQVTVRETWNVVEDFLAKRRVEKTEWQCTWIWAHAREKQWTNNTATQRNLRQHARDAWQWRRMRQGEVFSTYKTPRPQGSYRFCIFSCFLEVDYDVIIIIISDNIYCKKNVVWLPGGNFLFVHERGARWLPVSTSNYY